MVLCRPLTRLSKGAMLGWGGHLGVAVPAAAMVMVEWWAYDIANLVAGKHTNVRT